MLEQHFSGPFVFVDAVLQISARENLVNPAPDRLHEQVLHVAGCAVEVMQ